MQSWRSPVYASGRLELSVVRDWAAAAGYIIRVMIKNPVYPLLLVAMAGIDSLPVNIPGIAIAEELIILYVSYAVIKMTWAKINNLDENTVYSEFKGAEKRLLALTFTYGIKCLLLSLLLVVPGIIWGIRNSIALAVTCLEELPVAESFKRSQQLMKGNMWIGCGYMFAMPTFFFALILGGLLGWGMVVDANNAQPNPLDLRSFGFAVTFVFSLLVSCLQLAIASIMVRMYAYTKGRLEQGSEAYVPDLTPKWNKN